MATQDAKLVAQDRDLDVLGCIAIPPDDPEDSTQNEIDDREKH